MDYAVAYERLFHMLKYADVIMVEFCGLKQKTLGMTSFQVYHLENFSDGFLDFYFVIHQVLLSTDHV